MESFPDLTEAAVRRLARPQSFERGENYYEKGAVFELVRRGSTLQAAVEGSQYEPYQIRIEFDTTGIVETACSCPYDHGGIRKHRVAVLLTVIRDPDTVTDRPLVSDLIADLDRETLITLLNDLLEEHPSLVEWVERELGARAPEARSEGDSGETPTTRQTAPDPETIRRHVESILYPSGPPTRGAQDPYAAMESRVDDLRDLLAEARAFIDAGDGESALTVLEAIATELMDGEWLRLSHDDSTAIFEFFDELSAAFTEALLTADLSETDREEWADQIAEWADELASYTRHPPFKTAVVAARRGWDDDALQQALAGADDTDLWGGECPWYVDDLLEARLAVLEREGRTDEYLNLARATGQSVQYATKLVDVDRVDEAVEYARDHLSTPDDALAVAKTLRDGELSVFPGLSALIPRAEFLCRRYRQYSSSMVRFRQVPVDASRVWSVPSPKGQHGSRFNAEGGGRRGLAPHAKCHLQHPRRGRRRRGQHREERPRGCRGRRRDRPGCRDDGHRDAGDERDRGDRADHGDEPDADPDIERSHRRGRRGDVRGVRERRSRRVQ